MKLEDMPTPKTDVLIFKHPETSELITKNDQYNEMIDLAWSLEQRLALAVAALKDIRTADDDCVCDSGYSANTVAIETIAQIEEGK